MQRLVVAALLLVMPLGGLRVLCAESPAEASRPSAPDDRSLNCEHICLFHHDGLGATAIQHHGPPTQGSSDCVLREDDSYVSGVFATAAVPPSQSPQPVPVCASAVPPGPAVFGLQPDLATLEPPPKPLPR